MGGVFLHVDLDAFFASVEVLDHPEWKGKPVIVGGIPGDRRAVVSTASYEARKYGVHSAMPLFKAVQLCPTGIYVRGNYKRYHELSQKIMGILAKYSPDIQQISIDEAFVDITGTERLFGPYEQTAMNLKNEVFAETGLTISVGMASTKYLAKIASGMKKPDGFFKIPRGYEKDFMLSLPLEKVWGIGGKTLSKLHESGIRTTKELYSRSLPLLQSLFGQAAGEFLYSAVRGEYPGSFDRETKSRSISNESTYPYDLYDKEIIETSLLRLCESVIFRMRDEKVRSKTAFLKLRYDDFSTISVQETSDRYVTSLEDLFEREKRLIEKKSLAGRGIRLLGVGIQNLEDEGSPRQTELFDFGEEKKAKVEQAVFASQKKHPEIKITKARLIDGGKKVTVFLLSLAIFTLCAAKSSAEEDLTKRDSDGAASIVFDKEKLPLNANENIERLFGKDLGGNKVEFFASGYWKSSLSSESTMTSGFGTDTAASIGNPVFTQNVDLSLWLMVNRHWYFEADFADEFKKNTIAAGYLGDGTVKAARIANRGIVFPEIYSISDAGYSIGGGENEAPGFSISLGGKSWKADAAVRYDMLATDDKSWYGKYSVSEDEIDLSKWNTGSQYFLPSAGAVTSVTDVYVQNASGEYSDSQGLHYKKLDSSQYLLIASSSKVILSKDAKAYRQNGSLPAVAFAISPDYLASLKKELGKFGKKDSPGSHETFLGAVQAWFSTVNLSEFSYGKKSSKGAPGPDSTGNETDGFFSEISGETVLFVQHAAGFSPFAAANRYDLGINKAADISVVSKNTGVTSKKYLAAEAEEDFALTQENFLYQNHAYADVYLEEASNESPNSPKIAFPFAEENPGIYLGYGSNNDLILKSRTYTAVSRYDIGTDAVPGTVKVYINGVLDSGAKYDPESGSITLSSPAGTTDRIYATWSTDSGDSGTGTLAAAVGLKKTFTQNFSGDISLASRLALSPLKKYGDADYSAPGYAAFATGLLYKKESFEIQNTLCTALDLVNTTGSYRILGMDENEGETQYLSKTAGVDLPENFVPTLNTDEGIELTSEFDGSIDSTDGKSDSEISGYAIPISWDFSSFSSASSSSPYWAGEGILIPEVSNNLPSASTFSIAIKNAGGSEDFSLYLQLGVQATKDFESEPTDSVPTWKISDPSASGVKSAFTVSSSQRGWQIVTVTLTDKDRSRLSASANARLIITGTENSSGTIYAGPYEAGALTFTIEADEKLTVTSMEKTDSSLSSSKIDKFNSKTNYVQEFSWRTDSLSSLPNSTDSWTGKKSQMTFFHYFDEIDLENYKELAFWCKFTSFTTDSAATATSDDEILSFELLRPTSYTSQEKTAIYCAIPYSQIKDFMDDSWKKITVSLLDKKVFINGKKIAPSSLKIDTSVVSAKVRYTLNPAASDGTYVKAGSFAIDELSLDDAIKTASLQEKASIKWKKDEEVIKAGDYSILKDLALSTTGSIGAAKKIDTDYKTEKNAPASAILSATVTQIKSSGSVSFSSETKSSLTSASHSFETESPLVNIFDFSEKYSYIYDSSLDKENSAGLNFNHFGLPLSLFAKTSANADSWSQNQNASGKVNLAYKHAILTTEATVSQKLNSHASSTEELNNKNYASGWQDSTKLAFSKGKENASQRTVSASASAEFPVNFAHFRPKVSAKSEGKYKSASSILFTDSSSAGISLPFSLAKNNFALSWTKAAGGVSKSREGGSYERDRKDLQEVLADKDWFLKACPILDLTSVKLRDKILSDTNKSSSSAESEYYTGTYNFTWKRPLFNSIKDFFLPSSADLSAVRDIRTSTSVGDTYQYKAKVGWTAVNIFGRQGQFPLFACFATDEYTASFSAAVKVPRTSQAKITMLYSGYSQASFFISKTDSIKTGLEYTIESKDDLSAKGTLIYKRAGKSSLITGAIAIFKPSIYQNPHLKISRTDSVNAGLSRATSTSSSKITKKYSFDYTHSLDMGISKYVTINTEISGAYNATWDKVVYLTGKWLLGCTIQF